MGAGRATLLHWKDIKGVAAEFLYNLGFVVNLLAIFILFFPLPFLFWGIWKRGEIKKVQENLGRVGLKAGDGTTPWVKSIVEKGSERKTICIESQGIGKNHYQNKKEDLEASFNQTIESISSGTRPGEIIVNLTSEVLPEKCKYVDLAGQIKRPYEFIIGQRLGGTVTQSLAKLPHMLVSGTTNQGKTSFLRQALLGLAEHSNNLQMYLVDLKGGIAMNDFRVLPSVQVASTEREATSILNGLVEEMKERISSLAENGYSEIKPIRDRKDIILLVVDEASKLYVKPKLKSELSVIIDEARDLTDELTKQARACGIHVILATQKVSKDTIETRVQENISGRLGFRALTNHGSQNAIGTSEATHLDNIPGRAVWRNGVDSIEVQIPYVAEKELRERLRCVVKDFEVGRKKCFSSPVAFAPVNPAASSDADKVDKQ